MDKNYKGTRLIRQQVVAACLRNIEFIINGKVLINSFSKIHVTYEPSDRICIPYTYIYGLVRFAEKINQNTVLTDLL